MTRICYFEFLAGRLERGTKFWLKLFSATIGTIYWHLVLGDEYTPD